MIPSRSTLKPLVMALALCACARSAPSAVTAVDVVPDQWIYPSGIQFNVDLDGNGFVDVWFILSPTSATGLRAFTTANVRIQSVADGNPGGFDAWPIAFGESIGPLPASPADWVYSPAPQGHFLAGTINFGGPVIAFGYFPGVDGYLGVEMTLPDGIHYGYINVSVFDQSNVGELKSYGFETTPGVSIIAGATPEPGRMMLLLLAASACWLRRRRRANDSE